MFFVMFIFTHAHCVKEQLERSSEYLLFVFHRRKEVKQY